MPGFFMLKWPGFYEPPRHKAHKEALSLFASLCPWPIVVQKDMEKFTSSGNAAVSASIYVTKAHNEKALWYGTRYTVRTGLFPGQRQTPRVYTKYFIT
jgi:hypothetical protein